MTAETEGAAPLSPDAPAPGSRAKSRDAYYDGVRGVAILTVVAYHWLSSYTPLFAGGYVGVDIFFVLSGFIITTILWRRTPSGSVLRQYGTFLIGRLKRLYPALLGLLVVGTLIVAALGSPVSPAKAVHSAVIAGFQLTSFAVALGIDNVDPFPQTWSLSVEWIFYLVWPLVLLALKSRGFSPTRLAVWAGAIAAVLYVISLPTSPFWFYAGITSRAGQILIGSALSLWAIGGGFRVPWSPRLVGVLGTAALAVIGLWTVFGVQWFEPLYRVLEFPLITLAAGMLCIVPIVAPNSLLRRVTSIKPLAFIGLISYSLYLWHLLAIQSLNKDTFNVPFVVLILIGLIGTAVLTASSYLLLERPFTKPRAAALQFSSAAAQPRP